jgi:hypothetical protein
MFSGTEGDTGEFCVGLAIQEVGGRGVEDLG